MRPGVVATLFEAVAFVLLAIGLGYAGWLVWQPLGFVAAALVLFVAGFVIELRGEPRHLGGDGL